MTKAKEITGLDGAASASDGIKLTLLTRMDEMCAGRDAALDWSDIEGVHDMRVASRRLRSALHDFAPYLRKRRLSVARGELKAVAGALGKVRDHDVAIEELEKLAAGAPPEIAAGIEKFADERRAARVETRAMLLDALTEQAIAQLREDFSGALEKAVKPRGKRRKKKRNGERADESFTFRDAGREIITARLAEVHELSASLYHPLDAEPLHRLRIAAKRLRYAIELFSQCFPAGTLKPFAEEVAALQSSLGTLHDCDEWIAALGARLARRAKRAQAADDDGGGVETDHAAHGDVAAAFDSERCAAVWLLNRFVKTRAKHFRLSLARWNEWETNRFIARLHDALVVDARLPAHYSGNGEPLSSEEIDVVTVIESETQHAPSSPVGADAQPAGE